MTLGPNLKLGTLLFLFTFIIGAVALYGGATLVDRPDPVTATDDPSSIPVTNTFTLVAESLRFDKRSVAVGSGAQVSVTLENKDSGTLHNVAFYTSRAASQTIHKGELFPGPMAKTETFTAPSAPGSYFFRCDAHPDTMTGTFIVQ